MTHRNWAPNLYSAPKSRYLCRGVHRTAEDSYFSILSIIHSNNTLMYITLIINLFFHSVGKNITGCNTLTAFILKVRVSEVLSLL